MGAWTILNDRNKIFHNLPIPTIEIKCDWILAYLEEFQKVQVASGATSSLYAEFQTLIARREETIMNTDAAYDAINRKIGIGIVIRDKQGNLKAAHSKSSQVFTTPLCAEAAAVLERLQFARDMDLKCITVLTDSLLLE